MQRDFLTQLLRCAASVYTHAPRDLGTFLSGLKENIPFERRLKLLFLYSSTFFPSFKLEENLSEFFYLVLFSVMVEQLWLEAFVLFKNLWKECFETCISFVPCYQDRQSDILYKFWTAVTQTLSSQFQSATDCKYSVQIICNVFYSYFESLISGSPLLIIFSTRTIAAVHSVWGLWI